MTVVDMVLMGVHVRCQADAIYEDDEMYGGFGSPTPPAGPGDVKIPFRATFDKEDKDKK